jgi:dimethylglycine dehydrogenase
VLALRVSYVGELGWELHAPVEQLAPLYDSLWRAGAVHGIADFGVYAMDSLRLEKCYRAWKSDLTEEISPLAAGLGRLVNLGKPGFLGREALIREHNSGPRERLVPLTLDDPGEADAPASSPVWSNGAIVGLTASGGYGHTIGKSIALACVRPEVATLGGKLDVEILGIRRAATIGADPLYDPLNARLKA